MRTIARMPLTKIQPDPSNVRKHFDQADLLALGASLKVRQNDPIQVKPEGPPHLILDGERRYRAAKLVGLTELDAIITDIALSHAETQVVRITGCFHRQDLTSPEKTDAVAELLQLNPTWKHTDAAAVLHCDPARITHLLSPLKCVPEVQEAYRTESPTISDVYEYYKLTADEQRAALASGLKGRAAIASRRKQTEGVATPAVRQSRIRHPLSTGIVVSVAGPDMSLGEYIDALAAALDAALKASKDQLDVKTAERVWKDRAKAGG